MIELMIEVITGLSCIIAIIYNIYLIRKARHEHLTRIHKENEANKIIVADIKTILRYDGNYQKIAKKIKEESKEKEAYRCINPLFAPLGLLELIKDFFSFSSVGPLEISPRITFSTEELKFLRRKASVIKVLSLPLFILVVIFFFQYTTPEHFEIPILGFRDELIRIVCIVGLASFAMGFLLLILKYLVDKGIRR